MRRFILIPVLLLVAGAGIVVQGVDMENKPQAEAVIGGGCFWCVEAVYERIDGITSAVSGYAGGTVENPSYEQVSAGKTGHAEVVKLTYDPNVISYREILDLFFTAHDPTTVNRQGADVGPQYRSIILYMDEEQRRIAEEAKAAAGKNYDRPVVTQIVPLKTFYLAEEYHQDYYDNNPFAGYCSYVIQPKLRKLGLEWRSIK
ncbi:peptide-methionine (S)-S-oxide reductase MsrA [Marispirochaeta aestuarii]|uniref:peptide-methionine (S)-S-oxide reductase MsrA n=1 Tax=Marispirochaeta aestuarii TaxID=1963862 RepID=UPI002ABE2673|nr:peptide-methionine (S)-S-oxide reductase MsrA [Marispirochaeta aestuarii]